MYSVAYRAIVFIIMIINEIKQQHAGKNNTGQAFRGTR